MLHYNTAHGSVSFSPLDVVQTEMSAVGFLHGTRIFKTNSNIPVNTHIISFLIFFLIQKSSSFILATCHHVLNHIVIKPLDQYSCPRQNERLKILFCFPENPHIIKTHHI